jgi:GNAT superfamily N-acetyltransferase
MKDTDTGAAGSTMLAAYLKEKHALDTYKTDEGFVTYVISQDGDIKTLNITMFYVHPEKRRGQHGTRLARKFIEDIAQEQGVSRVTAVCEHSLLNSESSMAFILSYRHNGGSRFKIVPEPTKTKFMMELK